MSLRRVLVLVLFLAFLDGILLSPVFHNRNEIPTSPLPPLNPDDNKYFHEPGGDQYLHHYDVRYFKKVATDKERKDTLRNLIRAYLTTFEDLGLETWIAHGSLLGWYWGGEILTWDWDLDTQVDGRTLEVLAQYHNQTIHEYDPGNGTGKRQYLLDVNPWSWQRDRGDGANLIDARFISMDNGLFVDITGLSEVYPQTEPGVLMCKNDHRYKHRDIFPLQDTDFEGVMAKVPSSYVPILEKEYTKHALVDTKYNGHTWDDETRKWVKDEPGGLFGWYRI